MPSVAKSAGAARPKSTSPDRRAALARSREQAILCAQSCDNLRGKDTVILDLSHITPLFDFFVITTGNNARQMAAIVDGTNAVMKENGSLKQGMDGRNSNWVVQDYGDIVLHVFDPDARNLYNLDGLWGDAKRVEWTPAPVAVASNVTVPVADPEAVAEEAIAEETVTDEAVAQAEETLDEVAEQA